MATIHFLNVLEGDCNIIQHDSNRVTVIDVSNAFDGFDTEAEKAVKASELREAMRLRTLVPKDKRDYGQKKHPDNPIPYMQKFGIKDIFRFIITHPDMDHIDGIRDLYSSFNITNTWDTNNRKEIPSKVSFGAYNKEDWDFYTQLRAGNIRDTKRLCYHSNDSNLYYSEDNLKILSPTHDLIKKANTCGNFNDSSYVLLFTPPKSNGKKWKFLFAGDSEDCTWEHILSNHSEEVANVDVLFAPHHGRDSGRSYEFLKILNPRVTLFGNASSQHLAYSCYKPIRITNNQAGYVIIDISNEHINFYVKNFEFAHYFTEQRGWSAPILNRKFDAYPIFKLS
ncbi:MBL fold metallo-hydrolase [Sphingobacterium cellulitidis]|uniref:ComEC/Rec2 family competence protein n=1 Tax=Sphingobacterium cellulitidis TaxID=1768011 RepID=UPI000B93BC29|nr:MBL fold metallo-hydrolase [Sphingobacterium cellulitidis]OYD46381.1 MBL fold metallo-hydrolase [Sphingobacterium cellulitidis]